MARTRFTSCLVRALGIVLAVLGPLLFAPMARAQISPAAQKALESAAKDGSAPAQYALGAGAESAGDLTSALRWYQQAANSGYGPAEYKLGQFFESGKGVPVDLSQALSWYRKAAAQGIQEATARVTALSAASPSAPASSSLGVQPNGAMGGNVAAGAPAPSGRAAITGPTATAQPSSTQLDSAGSTREREMPPASTAAAAGNETSSDVAHRVEDAAARGWTVVWQFLVGVALGVVGMTVLLRVLPVVLRAVFVTVVGGLVAVFGFVAYIVLTTLAGVIIFLLAIWALGGFR